MLRTAPPLARGCQGRRCPCCPHKERFQRFILTGLRGPNGRQVWTPGTIFCVAERFFISSPQKMSFEREHRSNGPSSSILNIPTHGPLCPEHFSVRFCLRSSGLCAETSSSGPCCGLNGIEAEDCSLASLRQIFLTLLAAGARRTVLGGKIADTRRPGPPLVGRGTRLWSSCYDIFLREGQPMTNGTPPFSADAALRHFRS